MHPKPLHPSSGSRRPFLRRLRVVLAGALVAFSASCVSEQSVTGQKEQFAYSWQQELELGAGADKDIVAEMGLYPDDGIQAYIARIGEQVLAKSDMRAPNAPQMYRDTKFTFRVLNSPVINAFALPGGYVYVTRGLLTHVRNEAQLAVVIGHEIAHVSARHASDQALKAQRSQLGLAGVAILSQIFLKSDAAQNIASQGLDILGQGLGLLMLKYGRDAENEADQLGVKFAAQDGYATAEGSHFFTSLQRISAVEGRAIPTWQSSHPDPGDRSVKVRQLSATYAQPGDPKVGEEEFLREIEGMPIGDNPREGFVEGNTFYHPDLKFQFPVANGWKLQNDTSAVIQVDPNQRAILGFQLAPGSNAREAAARFAQESGVQVVSSGTSSIAGNPAFVILAQAATEQGTVGIWSAFIEWQGRVVHFLGYSAANSLMGYRQTFESVASGFRELTDSNRLSVQPARVALVRTDRSGRLADFLPSPMPKGLTPEALAIMNQVTLDETIPAGRTLKIPRVGN